MRTIEDREYRRHERDELTAFAARIRGAGVSLSEIARGTHLSYKTISKAASSRPIYGYAMIRIDYYLTLLKREQNKAL